MSTPRPDRPDRGASDPLWSALADYRYLVLLIACGLLAALGWVGFIASDDQYYYSAGLGWLNPGWYVADHFGRVRNAVALPIAVAIALFGDSEFAVVLPSLLYYFLTLTVVYLGLARYTDRTMALLASLGFGLLPISLNAATTVSADVAELFWATVAFWLFFHAWMSAGQNRRDLFFCGMALAMAFSGRESVVALGIFFALLILFSRRLEKAGLLYLVLGGLTILGVEALYYGLVAGDPLLRVGFFFQGAASSNDRVAAAAFSIDSAGALRVHPLIDPVLLVLAPHRFGIAYWLFLAAILLVLRDRLSARHGSGTSTESEARDLAMLALAGGAFWFAFVAATTFRIALVGRYYLSPACLLAIGSAAYFWTRRSEIRLMRTLGWLLAAGFALDVAGTMLQNRDPRFAERALAALAASAGEPVYTDPYTTAYTGEFLRWAGADRSRIIGSPPHPGSLYYVVPTRIATPNRLTPAAMLPALQVQPTWTMLRRIEGPTALPAWLSAIVRQWTFLPASARAQLAMPRGEALVYRVGLDDSPAETHR